MYIPSVRYLFLHMTLSYCPVSFRFYLQNSSISCRTGLVLINSLRLCLPGNILISLSLLKVTFARYRIPGWQFLSSSTLTVSVHCLLGFKVSDEESADKLTEDHLYIRDVLFLWLLSRSCLCLSTVWLQCPLVWVSSRSPSWSLLSLVVYIHAFYPTWEVFSCYFLQIISSPFFPLFWNSCSVHGGFLKGVPLFPLANFSLIFFLSIPQTC